MFYDNTKNFYKRTTRLFFETGFLFWLIFACLEIVFPGMIIHYVNMNFWLLVVCLLAIINVIL